MSTAVSIVMGPDGLVDLVDELERSGYEVWGPAVRDGAVVTRRLTVGDRLPIGYTTDQTPGAYGLVETGDRSRFGWATGPQSWKPLLHPASITTMRITQREPDGAVAVSVAGRPPDRMALFGLRPCDLAAVDKLDRVLLDAAPSPDPTYQGRRQDAFLIVVNCATPASTCFCTSMDTGPHVDGRSASHDLEITELMGDAPDEEPEYTVTARSDRGSALLERLAEQTSTVVASDDHRRRQEQQRDTAAAAMGDRHPLASATTEDALRAAHDSPRWEAVAEACLACGNCTAVCPTCFCTTVNDVGDLSGGVVERRRDWESCFALEFSRLGSHPVRSSIAARYRQWMTHKLGTWHSQFDESGCVGCGRCTTWCPAGIDFVAVATAMLDDPEVAPS